MDTWNTPPEFQLSKTSNQTMNKENNPAMMTREKALTMVKQIKSTQEINIGDVLMFTGGKGGIEIGSIWKMETKGQIVAASIAIIEDGQHWWPVLDEYKKSLL